jgi:hypothetical protein
MGIKQRMIDIGKQITVAKCLKTYSFFAYAFKVCKKGPKTFFCEK